MPSFGLLRRILKIWIQLWLIMISTRINIQIETSDSEKMHNSLFLKEMTSSPISDTTALRIIKAVIEQKKRDIQRT